VDTNSPLVSVVLPTFNRASTIKRAISSVLSQTYKDLELIVIDDGSTDDTEQIAAKSSDGRLRYIRYQSNRGATHARNLGIGLATGEYIAFQDSDDEWLPDKLSRQVETLAQASAETGVVFTGYWRALDNRRVYMPFPRLRADNDEAARKLSRQFYLFVATPSVLVKRECFTRVGLFDERLSRLQEWELWIRFSQYYRFAHISEPLMISHHQPDSITANYEALATSFDLILERHREIFEADRQLLARILVLFGRHILNSPKTFSTGQTYLLRACRINPLNPTYVLLTLFSLFGFRLCSRIKMLYRMGRTKT
jgi:glycosyltransferase involved in cell wall biosynthesis